MSKKLKILIATHEMRDFFGGVQTFSIALYDELKSLGHQIDFYTKKSGRHNEFKKKSLPESSIRENFFFYKKYDLIICSTKQAFKAVKSLTGIKILIIHGILSKIDKPVDGADIYLAVSEEVVDSSKGNIFNQVIRNPINCDYFNYIGCSEKLKSIAFLDRRRKFPYLKEVQKLGYKIKSIGNPPVYNIKNELKNFDLVVARGRGAYEAMAIGKNVIISGNNSGRSPKEIMDGFITNESFLNFRRNNCSGRYNAIELDNFEIFLKEIKKYDKNQGFKNRKLILKYNNVKKIAIQILKYF